MSDALFDLDELVTPAALPTRPRWSAADIADALDLPRPTPQQTAVIEAPLTPSLVVAGAGSGKTETMSARVVWLLANELVGPAGILGLTFTRKAAGELAERVHKRVGALSASGLLASPFDPFDAPTVSTYNAFASTIFREHAVSIGREPDATVLGDAAAWQLARRVVSSADDPELVGLDKSVDRVTEGVLALSAALSENGADIDEVARMAGRFASIAALPIGNARKKKDYDSVTGAADAVGSLPVLLRLATRYAEEKTRRGLIEFSDQVAFALDIVQRSDRVRQDYRERFPVVLLDEYQDTSVGQTRLLASLFRDSAVMAVGDPHQSIYGWRGASASNLGRFADDFASGESPTFALSISWRNPPRVLAAADALVAPLSAASAVPVETLAPRPGADEGVLEVVFEETILDEAARVADWLAARIGAGGPQAPSAAILCRSLKKVAVFTKALAAREVRFHVLGIGGLLEEPSVADLVSVLHALDDPSAGAYLIRVLTGARWRIGLRDIKALRELAGWLAERDVNYGRLTDEVRDSIRGGFGSDEGASLVDALDFVAVAREGHTQLDRFSPEGLERLRRAAAELADLRRRTGLGLVDLVALVIEQASLDIEVSANESSTLGRGALDSFLSVVDDFVGVDPSASLRSFLAWLHLAEERENLGARSVDPEPGTVQILTIHGSKGLEWDLVVVPRMVEGELPSPLRSSKGWLAFAELPYEFRGDAADLPALGWAGCADQREFDDECQRYQDAVKARDADEQRRLAYVAVTRARHELLLSGSFWSTQRRPRGPGRFLVELAAAGIISSDVFPEAPHHDSNPLDALVDHIPWPSDPLGARRGRIDLAAAAVRSADPDESTPWTDELDLLLAERDELRRGPRGAEPPIRISASAFKDHVTDPEAVAQAMRRPIPRRPFRQTRLGTLFHSWVEQRSGAPVAGDLVDALAFEIDHPDAPAERDTIDLATLQRTFEASEWGELRPEAVELEIHLPLADRVVVCKLDAVYRRGERWEIVDWKTGRPPRDAADLEQKTYQLALYRLAFATREGIDVDEVDAAFYFVAADEVIR
ncbi:MAG: ATP-dependent DNA helicase, partial [Naasia sp.]